MPAPSPGPTSINLSGISIGSNGGGASLAPSSLAGNAAALKTGVLTEADIPQRFRPLWRILARHRGDVEYDRISWELALASYTWKKILGVESVQAYVFQASQAGLVRTRQDGSTHYASAIGLPPSSPRSDAAAAASSPSADPFMPLRTILNRLPRDVHHFSFVERQLAEASPKWLTFVGASNSQDYFADAEKAGVIKSWKNGSRRLMSLTSPAPGSAAAAAAAAPALIERSLSLDLPLNQ